MLLRTAPVRLLFRVIAGAGLLLAVVAVLLIAIVRQAERKPAISRESVAGGIQQMLPDSTPAPVVRSTTMGTAAWYDVPVDSLARRRAGVEELTAAHNKLPLGTLVRVTHLKNGKNVLVRITDRGIHDRRVKIDLCKEAAEELEMVRKGFAKVRIEVLDDVAVRDSASHVATARR
jgi:rare lipoprotein A